MKFSNCINYLLTISQHEVFQNFFTRLSPYGITPGQYGVLNCLWENGPTTPKEIARYLRLENSTVSGVLDRMQRRGLIDRVVDPNNRRSIQVVALPEAQAIKDNVLKTVEELNIEILQDFTPEEKEILMKALCRIGRIEDEESALCDTTDEP
ncbi:MarR family winged helix-turn-helix transcriptional regulator [Clostridium minihomine]|uniref:MarR family winged helix-turn-helix transcriptional regulator n=1 Tax=Clostridium minihomine TaxID=2045012 RepID=UPI000C762F3E|nr:MarR family transcriptional regulator [Clostridium minihomine]